MQRDTIHGALLVSVFCCGWHSAHTGVLSLAVPVFAFASLLLCCVAGRLLVRVSRAGAFIGESFFATAVIGVLLADLVLLAVQLCSPFGAAANASIVGALVVMAARWDASRSGAGGARPARMADAGRAPADGDGFPLLLLSLILTAATFWSQDALGAFQDRGDAVVFKPWTDYFYQAGWIANFKHLDRPLMPSHIALSGVPMFFYHYASYQLPAAYAALTGSTAMTALCAFHAPMGVALCGMAACVLARSLWGGGAGWGAVMVLLFLPDASSYGLRHPWFGYHWLQQVAPAGLYGTAAAAMSLLCLNAACRSGSGRMMILSLGLAAGTILIKAQIAVHLLIIVALWHLATFPGYTWRKRLALAGGYAGLALAGMAAVHGARLAPPLAFSTSWVKTYLHDFLIGWCPGQAGGWLRAAVPRTWGFASDMAAAAPLLFVATLGAIGLVYLGFLAARRGVWRRGDARLLPLLVVAVYLLLALTLAPNASTVKEELQHRPFVLTYFVVACWTGCLADAAVRRLKERCPRAVRFGVPAVCAALCLVPACLGRNVTALRLPWARDFVNTPIPKDLLACTRFLREQTDPRDVVQASDNDPLHIVGSLSERRSYLARAARGSLAAQRALVRERAAQLDRLNRAHDARMLATEAERLGIDWYILGPDDRVDWPAPVMAAPVFRSGGYRVYRLAGLSRRGS